MSTTYIYKFSSIGKIMLLAQCERDTVYDIKETLPNEYGEIIGKIENNSMLKIWKETKYIDANVFVKGNVVYSGKDKKPLLIAKGRAIYEYSNAGAGKPVAGYMGYSKHALLMCVMLFVEPSRYMDVIKMQAKSKKVEEKTLTVKEVELYAAMACFCFLIPVFVTCILVSVAPYIAIAMMIVIGAKLLYDYSKK